VERTVHPETYRAGSQRPPPSIDKGSGSRVSIEFAVAAGFTLARCMPCRGSRTRHESIRPNCGCSDKCRLRIRPSPGAAMVATWTGRGSHRVSTAVLHRPNPVAREMPGFIGFFARRDQVAEREGLPRSVNENNKIKGLSDARSRPVYQSSAPMSSEMNGADFSSIRSQTIRREVRNMRS
jgi:hypothetical protein